MAAESVVVAHILVTTEVEELGEGRGRSRDCHVITPLSHVTVNVYLLVGDDKLAGRYSIEYDGGKQVPEERCGREKKTSYSIDIDTRS